MPTNFVERANLADDNTKRLVYGFIRQFDNHNKCITPALIKYMILNYYFLWNRIICVKGQDGSEVWFKITINKKLGELMDAWVARQGNNKYKWAYRWLFDGDRINPLLDTPLSLQMEDEDEIDVMVEGS